jgi:hypothetical protein
MEKMSHFYLLLATLIKVKSQSSLSCNLDCIKTVKLLQFSDSIYARIAWTKSVSLQIYVFDGRVR